MAAAAATKKRAHPNLGGGDDSIGRSSSSAPPLPPSRHPIAGRPADARARIVACLSLGTLVRLGPDIAAAFLDDDDNDQVWRHLAQRQWPVLRRLQREGDWAEGRAVAWVERSPVPGSPPLCLPSACRWRDVYCAVMLAFKRCVGLFSFGLRALDTNLPHHRIHTYIQLAAAALLQRRARSARPPPRRGTRGRAGVVPGPLLPHADVVRGKLSVLSFKQPQRRTSRTNPPNP